MKGRRVLGWGGGVRNKYAGGLDGSLISTSLFTAGQCSCISGSQAEQSYPSLLMFSQQFLPPAETEAFSDWLS